MRKNKQLKQQHQQQPTLNTDKQTNKAANNNDETVNTKPKRINSKQQQ